MSTPGVTAAIPRPAADLVREAALLAADCLLREPADAEIAPRAAWSGREAEWARVRGVAGALRLSPATWVVAAAAAAELHPDAAAAFSILSENERIALPTPAALARLGVTGLDVGYDTMLAAALAPSPLLDGLEPAGHTVPAAHAGLRLSAEGLALLFDGAPPVGAVEAATHRLVFAAAARAAAAILDADGAVWIRARSRRLGRQLALDTVALLAGGAVTYAVARDGEPLPGAGAGPAVPVLDLCDLDRSRAVPAGGPYRLVVAPERFEHPAFRAVDAPALGPREAAAVWSHARHGGATHRLASRFRLTLPELREAEREADTLAVLAGAPGAAGADAPTGAPAVGGEGLLVRAIRAAGARRMGPFVTTVDTAVTLDDLVATTGMRAQLEDAIAWWRTDDRVWHEMAVPSDAADGRGLALLFSGPPGGGKTFAARCVANTLDLNLYRVDLSQVVSKYIGETEKRLAQIFDEAEAGHGILFFDEADAVFGKRSEVKDAHDRYANIEVGFLLQRMESFGGIVVLATNLRSNLDTALLRRLHFIVDFPMPGRAERALLWQRNLPGGAWCGADVDVEDLATRFRLSGGNIRNAAVAAAHLAAADRAPLGRRHLARALYRELEKSGQPRGRADLGELADHLEEVA